MAAMGRRVRPPSAVVSLSCMGTGMEKPSERSDAIRALAEAEGFDLVGITDVQPSEHAAFFRQWLEAGRHGSMEYLARPDAVARREDVTSVFPELRSAVVVGMYYGMQDEGDVASHRGIIARYARGRDYHRVMKAKLLRLLREVERIVGRELPLARASVDTAPVFERELARRAGLGWFGRNTMLIHPRRGSYLFIGTLLLDVELTPDEPFDADRCGTCSACVEACPTGALLGRDASGAPVMDARRCISYLTIENRGAIPEDLRPLIGNRVFGCDICQEVCPYNRRFAFPSADPAFAARGPGAAPFGVQPEEGAAKLHPGTRSPSLIALLETALDEAAWDAFSRGSAIRRSGRAGFARNVCVGLGNWGSPDAVPVLSRALSDREPLVRIHAAWALGRVGSAEARSALLAHASAETDADVLEEVSAAVIA